MRHSFRPGWALVTVLSGLVLSTAQAPVPDPLVRAHRAYNAGQFDAAIAAARDAQKQPAQANAAAVVLARALLDRYRAALLASDLDDARAVLASVRPAELLPRDRVDFLIGLGLLLYNDGCTDGCLSAAAEFFSQALDRITAPELGDRDIVFEWWASVLDRHALYSPEAERPPAYARIFERAERELLQRDQSTSAAYWLAAAARGTGDLDRAWSASVSGWIGAKYQGPRGAKLRVDLDFLVTQVILPERARQQMPDEDARPALADLLKKWDELKIKYR